MQAASVAKRFTIARNVLGTLALMLDTLCLRTGGARSLLDRMVTGVGETCRKSGRKVAQRIWVAIRFSGFLLRGPRSPKATLSGHFLTTRLGEEKGKAKRMPGKETPRRRKLDPGPPLRSLTQELISGSCSAIQGVGCVYGC